MPAGAWPTPPTRLAHQGRGPAGRRGRVPQPPPLGRRAVPGQEPGVGRDVRDVIRPRDDGHVPAGLPPCRAGRRAGPETQNMHLRGRVPDRDRLGGDRTVRFVLQPQDQLRVTSRHLDRPVARAVLGPTVLGPPRLEQPARRPPRPDVQVVAVCDAVRVDRRGGGTNRATGSLVGSHASVMRPTEEDVVLPQVLGRAGFRGRRGPGSADPAPTLATPNDSVRADVGLRWRRCTPPVVPAGVRRSRWNDWLRCGPLRASNRCITSVVGRPRSQSTTRRIWARQNPYWSWTVRYHRSVDSSAVPNASVGGIGPPPAGCGPSAAGPGCRSPGTASGGCRDRQTSRVLRGTRCRRRSAGGSTRPVKRGELGRPPVAARGCRCGRRLAGPPVPNGAATPYSPWDNRASHNE